MHLPNDNAGESMEIRNAIFAILAEAERHSQNPAQFRYEVRWPIIQALVGKDSHRIKLQNGLIFEVQLQSRIEQAFLLSLDHTPDHVWEPQTTRLACTLTGNCTNVIVGGAYIGDQALPVAKVLQSNARKGVVYAFEPNPQIFRQLVRNIEINELRNVRPEQRALWDCSNVELQLQGAPALASTYPSTEHGNNSIFKVRTATIDEYVQEQKITDVGLIMLDIEGAEQQALSGAQGLLEKKYPEAPHIIFEVHSDYTDWSRGLANTVLIHLLLSFGYDIFAIRDLQGHLSMADRALKIVPLDDIYLAEVPPGFNMLATKDKDLATKYALTIVRKLSPKLLSPRNTYLPYPPKDQTLHLPHDGLGLELF
jgi:FkbM family methyltransferase